MNRRGFLSAISAGLATLAVSTRLATASVKCADMYTLEFWFKQGKDQPHIDEIRVTMVSRYTQNFKPPGVEWNNAKDWHHVAVVHDGETVIQYLDGVKQ